MDYIIRKIKESEYSILNDFLYEAIFIPEGIEAPPKEIINQPELRLYPSLPLVKSKKKSQMAQKREKCRKKGLIR